MNQHTFSRMRADSFTIERLRDFVFVGDDPAIRELAARRVIALWNRFVHLPTESFGEAEPDSGRSVSASAFVAWGHAMQEAYPNRLIDQEAFERIRLSLAEAEAIYAAMPVAGPAGS